MAVVATDNFDRTDESPLGGSWTGSVGGDLRVVSNVCLGVNSGADNSMYYNASLNDAQYAQITIETADGSGQFRGPFVRGSSTDWVFLDAYETTKWQIEWYNSGSWTVIGTAYSTAPADEDIGYIDVDGTDFTAKINGTERITGSNAGVPSSGYGGIYVYNTAPNGALDDFETGNLAEAGTTLTVNMSPESDSSWRQGVRVY